MTTYLTPHFSVEELTHSQTAARLGLDNTPDATVLENLKASAWRMEAVRTVLGHGISVSSGYRSAKVNHVLGGVATSAHLTGHAVDFNCYGFGTPEAVCEKIAKTNIAFDQLIQEGTWVHLSFAPPLRQQVLTRLKGGGYATGIGVAL